MTSLRIAHVDLTATCNAIFDWNFEPTNLPSSCLMHCDGGIDQVTVTPVITSGIQGTLIQWAQWARPIRAPSSRGSQSHQRVFCSLRYHKQYGANSNGVPLQRGQGTCPHTPNNLLLSYVHFQAENVPKQFCGKLDFLIGWEGGHSFLILPVDVFGVSRRVSFSPAG